MARRTTKAKLIQRSRADGIAAFRLALIELLQDLKEDEAAEIVRSFRFADGCSTLRDTPSLEELHASISAV